MSERILWSKFLADFASANDVSRETIPKPEIQLNVMTIITTETIADRNEVLPHGI